MEGAISALLAIGGVTTAIIAALSYAKSVSDTANERFYSLLQELSKYKEVTAYNAATIAVLVSRLDSEFFRSKYYPYSFLINTKNRGFEIAYIVIPFAKAFGDKVDTAGVLSAVILAKAISRVNDLVQRNRLVADWGSHINFVQGKNISPDYLSALMDVTCALDLLSERVGASTSDNLEECRRRLRGKF